MILFTPLISLNEVFNSSRLLLKGFSDQRLSVSKYNRSNANTQTFNFNVSLAIARYGTLHE